MMLNQKINASLMSGVLALGMALSGQAMADLTATEAAALDADAKAALAQFQAETKGSETVFANAKGILVCPKITKGGFIVGVEGGDCVLTSGAPTRLYYGTTTFKVGLLAGISSYSMILVFNTNTALANFTSGNREWELGAGASVAVATLGAGGELNTTNLKADIVSFIFSSKGLMADVSVEGSRFKKLDVASSGSAAASSLPTYESSVRGTIGKIGKTPILVEMDFDPDGTAKCDGKNCSIVLYRLNFTPNYRIDTPLPSDQLVTVSSTQGPVGEPIANTAYFLNLVGVDNVYELHATSYAGAYELTVQVQGTDKYFKIPVYDAFVTYLHRIK